MRSSSRSRISLCLAALVVAGCEPEPQTLKPIPGFVPQRGPLAPEVGDGLVIGHRLMEAGEFELALDFYTRALARRGIDADVLSAMGSANLRLGRLNQAETLLRKATERDPTHVAAWNNLGVVLLSQGSLLEARDVFRLAFAQSAGSAAEIGENLRLTEQLIENTEPEPVDVSNFRLVRQGGGRYLLLGK